MRDTEYLRSQADFCLRMASQISDRKATERLKDEAARYQARADAIEAASRSALLASGQPGEADTDWRGEKIGEPPKRR